MVKRFATSSERIEILAGLLRFRQDLASIGIQSGFQWLNGSFMERIEVRENRPPRDIDVVTFFTPPVGASLQDLAKEHAYLFSVRSLKTDYLVDGYFVQLGVPLSSGNVKLAAFWNSMWSHSRDGTWKGYLQVDLDPEQDNEAVRVLESVGGAENGR